MRNCGGKETCSSFAAGVKWAAEMSELLLPGLEEFALRMSLGDGNSKGWH